MIFLKIVVVLHHHRDREFRDDAIISQSAPRQSVLGMIRARFDDINLYVCVYSDVMCVVCPFPEESLLFLYLGFLKNPKQFAVGFLLRFRTKLFKKKSCRLTHSSNR